MNQVHKETLASVDNSLPNRQGLEVEIFGMEGIPEDVVQAHNQRIIAGFYQAESERRAATGNPAPGTANANSQAKKPKLESPAELKKRLAEHKARKAEQAANSSGGNTPLNSAASPMNQSPGAFVSTDVVLFYLSYYTNSHPRMPLLSLHPKQIMVLHKVRLTDHFLQSRIAKTRPLTPRQLIPVLQVSPTSPNSHHRRNTRHKQLSPLPVSSNLHKYFKAALHTRQARLQGHSTDTTRRHLTRHQRTARFQTGLQVYHLHQVFLSVHRLVRLKFVNIKCSNYINKVGGQAMDGLHKNKIQLYHQLILSLQASLETMQLTLQLLTIWSQARLEKLTTLTR
jgi:hypothetical protein